MRRGHSPKAPVCSDGVQFGDAKMRGYGSAVVPCSCCVVSATSVPYQAQDVRWCLCPPYIDTSTWCVGCMAGQDHEGSGDTRCRDWNARGGTSSEQFAYRLPTCIQRRPAAMHHCFLPGNHRHMSSATSTKIHIYFDSCIVLSRHIDPPCIFPGLRHPAPRPKRSASQCCCSTAISCHREHHQTGVTGIALFFFPLFT